MEIRQPAVFLDHMIRQTRAHHVQLSAMADMKANMMLTVAALLIPLSIRFLDDPRLQPAALTMIGFCILTVLLSAYAAMPKLMVIKDRSKTIDPEDPSFNLLFFGSFTAMDYDDFELAMEKVMNDHGEVYEKQIKEIYLMAQYLAREKYRFIRFAYISFITGMVISSSLYVIRTLL
ncbi:MAG: hypothetical protein KJN80_07860 [Deltaproteobacteria bacterium]|nr:hypothetical protein [Deltaproteobacteria bacterium]